MQGAMRIPFFFHFIFQKNKLMEWEKLRVIIKESALNAPMSERGREGDNNRRERERTG